MCAYAHQRGRVDGVALEDAGVELALLGHAEDLGHRPRGLVRLETLHGSRGEDEHTVRALAAEALLPREGDDVELVPRHVLREDLRAEGARHGERTAGQGCYLAEAEQRGVPAAARQATVLALVAVAELLGLSLALFHAETSGSGAPPECAEQPRAHRAFHSAFQWSTGTIRRDGVGELRRHGDGGFQHAGHTAEVESAMVRPLRSAL